MVELEDVENEIILIADPRVLAISFLDNQEEIIDLKNQIEIAYGSSPEVSNNQDYTYVRKSVYQKLKDAQKLLPKSFRFCLYEGFRSLSLQKTLFENRFLNLKLLYPEWSQAQLFEETIKMVSLVINKDGSKNIPPHSTAAAIDVYLINETGQALNMGIHPQDWAHDIKGEISLTNSNKISLEARQHRQIMSDALKKVGFVNYPTEYWHWSYGDRYWAYHTGRSYAIYGPIN